jgi:hypothetical protein
VATQPYSTALPPEDPTHDGQLLQANPTSKATHAANKNIVKQNKKRITTNLTEKKNRRTQKNNNKEKHSKTKVRHIQSHLH